MGQVRVAPYTSCTGPQAATNFQPVHNTITVIANATYQFTYLPGVCGQAVWA